MSVIQGNVFGSGPNRSSIVFSALYPLENAKVQLHLNQNPIIGPYNIMTSWNQMKLTYHSSGLMGCYTGCVPYISANLCYMFAFNSASKMIPNDLGMSNIRDKCKYERKYEKHVFFMKRLARGVICRTIAVFAFQPCYVVTVRMVAQLAKSENKYTDVISSLLTIIREEGVFGLFAGLLPRLLSELMSYTIVTTVMYVLSNYIDKSKLWVANIALHFAAEHAFYPLVVVSSRMAVVDSGLSACSPPNMPHYTDISDCLKHIDVLTKSRQPLLPKLFFKLYANMPTAKINK